MVEHLRCISHSISYIIIEIVVQAHYAQEAGYLMILLVGSGDCNFDGKECIPLWIQVL